MAVVPGPGRRSGRAGQRARRCPGGRACSSPCRGCSATCCRWTWCVAPSWRAVGLGRCSWESGPPWPSPSCRCSACVTSRPSPPCAARTRERPAGGATAGALLASGLLAAERRGPGRSAGRRAPARPRPSRAASASPCSCSGWAPSASCVALRRFFPQRLPYLLRQGLANLYRPANQTVTVVLALGFGAFLLGNVVLMQQQPAARAAGGWRARAAQPGLLRHPARPARGRGDGAPAAAGASAASGARRADADRVGEGSAPPPALLAARRRARRCATAGRCAASTAAPTGTRPRARRRWWRGVLEAGARREGRKGRAGLPGGGGGPRAGRQPWATRSCGTSRACSCASRVESLREVDWQRFEPNFFAVFPEGPLDARPPDLRRR